MGVDARSTVGERLPTHGPRLARTFHHPTGASQLDFHLSARDLAVLDTNAGPRHGGLRLFREGVA
jgi:hypothetical protein